MTMARAIVVGAGLGGLSAAIRLAARGWEVTVYEKNPDVGGRASGIGAGGFTWDAGPTLIMMPEVLHELFAAAGRRLEDYLELRRIDPYYRVVFEDGRHLDFTGNLPAMVAGVEAIEPGAGRRYLRFLSHAERLSHVARQGIIERSFDGVTDLLKPSVLAPLLRSRPLQTVASEVARHFRSPALRSAFSFQTLYLGTRPDRTPAAYLMIPFVEAALGVWYPMGGTRRIGEAMARVARELGVLVRTGVPVSQVLTAGGRARGVTLEGGARDHADAVVVNAEWAYSQRLLLDGGETAPGRNHGASAVLLCLAVRGSVPGPHHTFFLSGDFAGNLADVFERRVMPERPSIYLCRPTATDPGLAPAGVELLYALVPCPTLESGVDWPRELPTLRAKVLERLARAGIGELDGRLLAETVLTPDGFRGRYNLLHGSAFGLAATLFQSGPFRPTIRSRRYRGLYHVGASVHPGGGVPIVTLSGRLAAEAIVADFAGAPATRPVVLAEEGERAWSASS
jgi:phytoene desaturase